MSVVVSKRLTQRSVGFNAAQWRWLDREAKKLGISASDLLRRLVDAKRGA